MNPQQKWMRPNGNIGTRQTGLNQLDPQSNQENRTNRLNIKMLQQRAQLAEIKRYILFLKNKMFITK